MRRNRRFDEVNYMKRMAMLSFSRRMRRNRRFDEVNYEKRKAMKLMSGTFCDFCVKKLIPHDAIPRNPPPSRRFPSGRKQAPCLPSSAFHRISTP